MTCRLLNSSRAVMLSTGLALTACGGGAPDDADLAYRDAGDSTDSSLGARSEPAEPGLTDDGLTDDGLIEDGDAPTLPSLPTETDSSSPPTTLGSGLPPVTTLPPARGGDPDGLYRGAIGSLAPDEIVVAATAPPPPATEGILPLTGLPGRVPDRPAAVVKIDNGSAAAPHTGLNSADIVVEEEVEGGVTRFAAVFHSTPSIVGPVRSGRTTDITLLGGLGHPLLLYSGANEVTQGILATQGFIQLRAEGWSSGYWRDPSRRAPSNLYTDTTPHWASAFGDPPPPQFHYRDGGQRAAGTAVDEISVTYPSSTVRWAWEGNRWFRWQRGSEHLLANGQQVSAANVIVVEADEVATGLVDSSGGTVPEFVFVGAGRAVVFTDGQRIEGTWTRPTLTSVAVLTDGSGTPIELTPGRTWMQLVETGSGALS